MGRRLREDAELERTVYQLTSNLESRKPKPDPPRTRTACTPCLVAHGVNIVTQTAFHAGLRLTGR